MPLISEFKNFLNIHRNTTNASLRQSVGEMIQNSFEDVNSFSPSLVVVATWENVGHFDTSVEVRHCTD